MRIEERGLPPFFTYVNARLNGRPLLAAIWVIVMLATCALVYMLDPRRGIIGDVIIAVALLFILIVLAVLTSVASRRLRGSELVAGEIQPQYSRGESWIAVSRAVIAISWCDRGSGILVVALAPNNANWPQINGVRTEWR